MRFLKKHLLSVLLFFIVCLLVSFHYWRQEVQYQKRNPAEPQLSGDTITALDNKTFIISPYYDSRVGAFVRVLAIIHISVEELYCVYHCQNITVSVRAEIDLHRDRFGFPYGTANLLCAEPSACDYSYMSFRSPNSTNVSESIVFKVRNRPPPTFSSNFTVCISTLYGKFHNVLQMVQSIEMYKILGATRVTIYNTSCSRDVDKVLRHYIDEGTLEVVPWPIDQHLRTSIQWRYSTGLTSQIGYYGQIATLNDCLYRNMYRSKFVLLNDIDEIILPVKDWDWSSMMERLQEQHPDTSTFRFETHIFPGPMKISEFSLWSHVPGTNILHHHLRVPINRTVSNPRKMIVNPRKVFQTSIHYIVKSTGKSKDVPQNISITFHYKKRKGNAPKNLVQDDLVQRYNRSLVPKVDAVIQKLFPQS
ncbi:beta-1,4-galactosyltransferase galt-1-like [Gastrophryne carolinensis]